MKTLKALMCSLAVLFAPLAAAQAQKPPAKAPEKRAVRPVVELRQDSKRESCEKQAAEKKLRGGALETFMSGCLK